jgi:outer membrane protein
MKKLLLILSFFTLLPSMYAQKFAYVDVDYVLNKMPQYTSAQKQLDDLSAKWQKEIEAKQATVDKMYKDYKAEELLLTPQQKIERQNAIVAKENEIRAYQESKFGFEGELFKERQRLIKPIQDKVYVAIQKIAKDNVLDFIFDKSSDMIMLYSNPDYDLSDEVLKELGVVVKEDVYDD